MGDLNYVRDRQTGKPKGFAFLGYEDQRSTVLAVDNMNGYELVGRTLRVDHVKDYKAPKILSETDFDEEGNPVQLEYKPTGAEGEGHGVYNKLASQIKIDEAAKEKRKHLEKHRRAQIKDEDEAWAKQMEKRLAEWPALQDGDSDDGGKKKKKKKKKDKKKKEKKKDKKEKKEKKRKSSSSSSSDECRRASAGQARALSWL